MTSLKSHTFLLIGLLILMSNVREMANLRKGKKKVFGGSSIRYLELTLIKLLQLLYLL